MRANELINTDEVVALAKKIGDVLCGKQYLESIGALMVAMQCCIEDCIHEEKQIEVASAIMGKIITGLTNNKIKRNENNRTD